MGQSLAVRAWNSSIAITFRSQALPWSGSHAKPLVQYLSHGESESSAHSAVLKHRALKPKQLYTQPKIWVVSLAWEMLGSSLKFQFVWTHILQTLMKDKRTAKHIHSPKWWTLINRYSVVTNYKQCGITLITCEHVKPDKPNSSKLH